MNYKRPRYFPLFQCLRFLPLLFLGWTLGAPKPLAADWPQWRGPDRTDVSKETGLLHDWPEGGPKQVWVFRNAGLGYSGPAIAQGKLFTLGSRDGIEQLFALDINTGKELWAADVGPILRNRWGDGPRGTPAVDQDRVYALGGQGNLICASATTGAILWKTSMKDHGGSTPNWGYTESVLVDDNRLLCTPGGSKGTVLALDKMTGKKIWQSEDFTRPAHYASIITANHNGARQYIQLTEKHLIGVAAETGKLLWSVDFPGSTAVIPTPIFHEGQVYATAGYRAGCVSVQLAAGNETKELYANKVMQNHHGGVILYDGHVYGHSDGAGWLCQNFKTGEEVWSEKRALGKGAIAYADGRFYCLGEDNGTVVLIDASPKGWKEHGRLTINPQSTQRSRSGRIWTHPVISGGRLYLRDQEFIHCYDIARK